MGVEIFLKLFRNDEIASEKERVLFVTTPPVNRLNQQLEQSGSIVR